MTEFLLVGAGGALGALARFGLGRMITSRSRVKFPLGTFAVNLSGALLLGLLTSLGAGGSTYLILGEGFLGAYTTFSTLMYEGFGLFADKKRDSAAYIIGSLILGILGFFAGTLLGRLIG